MASTDDHAADYGLKKSHDHPALRAPLPYGLQFVAPPAHRPRGEGDPVHGSEAHDDGVRRTEGEQPLVAPFAARYLTDLRHQVAGYCARAGLAGQALDDFVLAIYEMLTNAVRHGGGTGSLRLWRDGDALVCEVRDTGDGIAVPGAGGAPRSSRYTPGGLGIWIAGQLTDSMRVYSGASGTTVRILARLRSR
jgi:serine/threonine-protein kinase RsbW